MNRITRNELDDKLALLEKHHKDKINQSKSFQKSKIIIQSKKKEIKTLSEKVETMEDKQKRAERFRLFIESYVSEFHFEFIDNCTTFKSWLADADRSHTKLYKRNGCKNRFCPICAFLKSRREALNIKLMIDWITEVHKKQYIFITLTTPNVKGEMLEDEIQHLTNSFNRLCKRRNVKPMNKGHIRKLEVTYDSEEYISRKTYKRKKAYFDKRKLKVGDKNPTFDTYNPHLHILMAVDKRYFTNTRRYIKHAEWLEMWRETTEQPEITQVKVERLKMEKGVSEIAKYSAKDSDYLQSEEVFGRFYESLKGKRLLVYGGLFREAHQKFKKGELDYLRDVDEAKYVNEIMYTFRRRKGKYFERKVRALSEEERQKVNNQLVEEMEID